MSVSKKDPEMKSKTSNSKDEIIFKSPLSELAVGVDFPDISFTQLLFADLDENYDELKDRIWIMDVMKEKSYKFCDIKPLSTKFASALTRLGFKKNDIFYFSTYDASLIYILQIGVWLCGGACRGCYQREEKEEYKRQLIETSAHFILCDHKTASSLKWAAEKLDWSVDLLSIGGKVEGATSVEEMIENDDGSAFPHGVKINAREDVLAILNTSGSSGLPKGVIHTHHSYVSLAKRLRSYFTGNQSTCTSRKKLLGMTVLTSMINYGGGTLGSLSTSIGLGNSHYFITDVEANSKKFLEIVLKYKPSSLLMYPYVAGWFVRSPDIDNYDLSFIKDILCVGTVLDLTTAKLLSSKLPQVKLRQAYAMSEILIAASSDLAMLSRIDSDKEEMVGGLKYKKLDDEYYVSSGILMPSVEAKILDSELGCTVGPNKKGNLWIRTPFIMKGYLRSNSSKGFISEVNEDGWFDTRDLAFFDETGHLYVSGRRDFNFKYQIYMVSPTEIEAVIGEHPAVLAVAVVAIPDPLTTSAARAYIVLKPGHQATEEEIKQYVADRKHSCKHLHGGVEFVDSLPENRGGKVDKVALLKRAAANKMQNLEGLQRK